MACPQHQALQVPLQLQAACKTKAWQALVAGPVLVVPACDTGPDLPTAAGVVDSIYDTGSPSNSGAVKLDLGELGATDAVLLGRGWSLPVHMCAKLST